MLNVTIDGKPVEMPDGITILAALGRAGVHVPHFCEDDRLAPVGACRLCLVRADGLAHPVAACVAALAAGMVIETHPPALEEQRRTILSMLARRHPRAALADPIDNAFLRPGVDSITQTPEYKRTAVRLYPEAQIRHGG